MKDFICTAAGAAGAAAAALFGGWDAPLCTLIIFMVIDYISGIILAGVFKRSPNSENGALSSEAGSKGLFKKVMILFFVLIAHRLDAALGTEYIKNAVIIGFTANELISITENAGLMGIPLPGAVTGAISVLKNRSEEKNGN